MICKYIGTKFLKMFCAVRFLKVSCFYGFVITLIFPIVYNMTSLAVIGARPLTPHRPKGARPLPSLTNAAFEDFSDQDRVASRTSRLIQEASGGTKIERPKKTQRKIERHTNQEGQPPKDSLNGIGCRYVDSQFVE